MVTKFAGALEHCFENKEGATKKNNLSGYAYVSARLRTGEARRETDKIIIAQVSHCGHTNRICAACAYQWGWDYQLNFHLTGGGRLLAEKIIQSGQDIQAIMAGKGIKPE
jgi:hypothetical protein